MMELMGRVYRTDSTTDSPRTRSFGDPVGVYAARAPSSKRACRCFARSGFDAGLTSLAPSAGCICRASLRIFVSPSITGSRLDLLMIDLSLLSPSGRFGGGAGLAGAGNGDDVDSREDSAGD
ncbi:hypothetical protein TOPH_02496 [Tolypocladium ophioglossoides CBS 100239]|uniref:Uncharacterized protein n=1 Tax=Tolypocladium ophioglossoides (strain CBS 100239) TaxID=1163406 RepID=A0A0L0NEQ7_TOLOC|nr:hypothetical protein TOPH_02496 [Tolypocladium ophioglossoides CBS 100239]